jgi:urea transport system permease protein
MSLDLLTVSSILFLVAIGLFIIFGLMGVVNLAHGEFIMIGAYAAFVTAQIGMNPWLSLLIAPIVCGFIGLIIERVLIRHLYGKIMESILATWGLSIVIIQVVELIFGKGYKPVESLISSSITIFGSEYPLYRLFIVLTACLLLIGFFIIERKTNFGAIVRAVIENPTLASSWGINVNKVYQVTFIVGSALAGFVGALIAPIASVNPTMGLNYVIQAFLSVLTGGANSLFGLLGSSFLLGGTKSIVDFTLDPIWGSISLVLIAILFMRLRESKI